MTNLSFRITGATHEGLVRTNNEDNFIINANLSEDNWFIRTFGGLINKLVNFFRNILKKN